MKIKIFLFAAACAIATSAHAEWVKLGTAGDITVSIKTDSIRRNGDIVRVWMLRDHKNARDLEGGKKYQSDKAMYLINCKEESGTIVSMAYYSGRAGSGNVVFSTTLQSHELQWEPNVPDTIRDVVAKEACKLG